MRRRDFIKFVAGSAAVWPLAARAQQPGKLPIIGYMGQGTPAAEAKRVTTFVGRLRELSWIEGRSARNVNIRLARIYPADMSLWANIL